MAITIQLPPGVESNLRADDPHLEESLRERILIDAYAAGKIGTADIADALSLPTRWDAERWLDERGVPMNYSLNDLEHDRKGFERLLGPVKR
jgi:predicted HTH domain antitoxin